LATNSASFDNLNWIKLEGRLDQNKNITDMDNKEGELNVFIPGGGIAQKFFKARYINTNLIKINST
jgi:hypothetical protein